MEAILGFLGSSGGGWLLGTLGVLSVSALLDRLLKRFVTDQRLTAVHDWFVHYIPIPGDWLGLALTKAGTQLPFLGKMWNKTIEPWVIVVLRTVGTGILDGVAELIRRIIKAMQSDNPSLKGD